MLDGEEVEEADVTMVLAGGGAWTQQDRLTGRGSTGELSEEGMEGRERERVRGLCARAVSGTGSSMGGKAAGAQLPFIPSRLPSEGSIWGRDLEGSKLIKSTIREKEREK